MILETARTEASSVAVMAGIRAIVLMECFEHLCRRFVTVSARAETRENPVAHSLQPHAANVLSSSQVSFRHGRFYPQTRRRTIPYGIDRDLKPHGSNRRSRPASGYLRIDTPRAPGHPTRDGENSRAVANQPNGPDLPSVQRTAGPNLPSDRRRS